MNAELAPDGFAEPSSGGDRALLKRLARACRDGKVAIEADPKRLQHIHSPVLSQADGNRWLLTILATIAALWWTFDWRWAIAALPLGAAVYLTFGRRAVHRRLMFRVGRRLDDPAGWDKLWSFGGIALREQDSGRRCAAPMEDWRGFVRLLANEMERRA